jgi:nitroreductase
MTLTQSPPDTLDTFTAIQARRSVKKYDPTHVMPPEQLEQLIDLAMLSPTSFNIQNWRFVVVTDKTQRQAMQAAAWGQAQVTEASAVILVCADLKAADKDPARYWVNAPQPVQDTIVPMIGQFYHNNPTLQRDEALRSVGMASQTIMLAAKAMGLDTCPMIGFDPLKVAELIRLPEDHIIGMMITVGKALEPAKVRSGQLPRQEVMEWNTF